LAILGYLGIAGFGNGTQRGYLATHSTTKQRGISETQGWDFDQTLKNFELPPLLQTVSGQVCLREAFQWCAADATACVRQPWPI